MPRLHDELSEITDANPPGLRTRTVSPPGQALQPVAFSRERAYHARACGLHLTTYAAAGRAARGIVRCLTGRLPPCRRSTGSPRNPVRPRTFSRPTAPASTLAARRPIAAPGSHASRPGAPLHSSFALPDPPIGRALAAHPKETAHGRYAEAEDALVRAGGHDAAEVPRPALDDGHADRPRRRSRHARRSRRRRRSRDARRQVPRRARRVRGQVPFRATWSSRAPTRGTTCRSRIPTASSTRARTCRACCTTTSRPSASRTTRWPGTRSGAS